MSRSEGEGLFWGRTMMELRSLFSVRLSVAISLLFGCTGCCGSESSSKLQRPKGQNEIAYDALLRAEGAQSYRDARYVLSQIETSKVTDPDLKEALEYQRRLAGFLVDVGVPKGTKMDAEEILGSINYKTLAKSLVERGVSKAHEEAVRIVDEGSSLLIGVDKYTEARETVERRYREG